MRLTSFKSLATVALAAMLCAIATACGGTSEGNGPRECIHVVPPPVVTEADVLRLDNLDLGETRDFTSTPNGSTATQRAPSYGYDLDGTCTDAKRPETLVCRRAASPSSTSSTSSGSIGPIADADGGVDNSFGKNLLTFLELSYGNAPSAALAHFSYLAVQADGRGTLYLGSDSGVRYVIPLVGVRLGPPDAGGFRTLAAIAPRDALVKSVLERINLISDDPYCTSNGTTDAVAETIIAAADIRVDGTPNAELECDGISIAMRISGTPGQTLPPIPPPCSYKPQP